MVDHAAGSHVADAFFVPRGADETIRRFEATDHARGPWDPGAQHGGPPSALVAHCLDADHPRPDLQLVRLTIEILRPVPVGVLGVETRVVRDGKKVQHLAATMTGPDGGEVIRATAWRIRTKPVDLGVGIEGDPLPGPEGLPSSSEFFRPVPPGGYVNAIETRFVSGSWAEFGPATVWLRLRHPIVEGHPVSPLERILAAADSGNGLSNRFDGLFINPDLTVQMYRQPRGEWIGVEAQTLLTDSGIGLARTTIHDLDGPVGQGAQTLLLEKS